MSDTPLSPEQALITYVNLAMLGGVALNPQHVRELSVALIEKSDALEAENVRLSSQKEELQTHVTILKMSVVCCAIEAGVSMPTEPTWADYVHAPENVKEKLRAKDAELQREKESLTQQLARFVPSDEGYRLTAADLDRLVNVCGSGNERSWAIMDLLSAHYEIAGQKERIEALEQALAEKDLDLAHLKKRADNQDDRLRDHLRSWNTLWDSLYSLRETARAYYDWNEAEYHRNDKLSIALATVLAIPQAVEPQP